MTQDDVLFPQLTVEETLIFSAFLRLSNHMSRCQKYQKVDMIIKELGLERSVVVQCCNLETKMASFISLDCFNTNMFEINMCVCITADVVTHKLEADF